jgi:hypothetical protein
MATIVICMTTATHPEAELTANIRKAMRDNNITREQVYKRIGISDRTFDRYMEGIEGAPTFTIPQIIRIGLAVGVDASTLLPTHLLPTEDAA